MRFPAHLCTVTVYGSNEQRVHEASFSPCLPVAGLLAWHSPHWIWPTGDSQAPFDPGFPSPNLAILHLSVGGQEP